MSSEARTIEDALNHAVRIEQRKTYPYDEKYREGDIVLLANQVIQGRADLATSVDKKIKTRITNLAATILKQRSFEENDPQDEQLRLWAVELVEIRESLDRVATSVPDETVESALTLMREKYPGGCPYIIAQDFTALKGRKPIEVRIVAGGTQYGKGKGDTLAEALASALAAKGP